MRITTVVIAAVFVGCMLLFVLFCLLMVVIGAAISA